MSREPEKTWIYSATEEPKVVLQSDAQGYYDEGWADTPAAFFDMKSHGLNPDSEIDVQIVGESIKGVAEAANGALNFERMTKKELVAYAALHLGKELNAKKNTHAELVAILTEALEPQE